MFMFMLKLRFVVLLLTNELNELALELSLLKLCCLWKLLLCLKGCPSCCCFLPPPYSLLIVIFLGTTYMMAVLMSVIGPVALTSFPPLYSSFEFLGKLEVILTLCLHKLKEPIHDLVLRSLRKFIG